MLRILIRKNEIGKNLIMKKDVNFIRAIQKENQLKKQVNFIVEQIQKAIIKGYSNTAIGFELDPDKCVPIEIVTGLQELGFTAYYSCWTNKLFVAW